MGVYITFNGGSGTGKGTVIKHLATRLSGLGYSVAVLKDNRIDPLREHGAQMLAWCASHGVNRSAFLLPMFAAGNIMSAPCVDEALEQSDVVLRNGSFVTNLAYTSGTTDLYSAEDVWDLYVNHLNMRLPDLAVILDADVTVASERMLRRTGNDIGLGGRISGDVGHRQRIREAFQALPEAFAGRLNAFVVSNNEPYSDDPDVLAQRIAGIVDEIANAAGLRGKRMPEGPEFEKFAEIFHENILKRSRKLRENTDVLIRTVWSYGAAQDVTPEFLCSISEEWFRLINDRFQADDAHKEEYEMLAAEAERKRAETGIPYRVNRYYRVWDASYCGRSIPLLELEFVMDEFYCDLAALIRQAQKGRISQEELLAFADYSFEGDIRPWIDNGDIIALAMVMWLSLVVPNGRLPLFEAGREHCTSMPSVEDYERYIARCLGLV
jgi:thymidylate kinase